MPVTAADVDSAAAKLGFVVPTGHEADYLSLLGTTDKIAQEVMAMPDYAPKVDLTEFPRESVHRPTAEENKLGGWAWKGTLKGREGGFLKGKEVCLKDTVCLAGVPQLFGTDAFIDFIPTVDATLVTRILENGGTIAGKAMCENFSHGASSFTNPYGYVENPYAFGFNTGGSSSGCGALVGSGEVEMGIGGDQGGSIRIPASLCGIVGMKPTFGLVPYTGVLSSCPAVDHVGPMTRTVYDNALLLEAIAGYDFIDDRQLGAPLPGSVPKYSQLVLEAREKGIKGLKIGILKEGFENVHMDKRVEKCVREAIEKFKALGAEIVEVSVPLHAKTGSIGHILNKLGSSQTRQGRQVGRRGLYINEYWDKLLPWDQEKYDKAKYYVTGTSMSAEYGWANYPSVYGKAMNIARQFKHETDAALEQCDVFIMPTIPQPARRHAAKDAGPLAWTQAAPGTASNTAGANLTCHPSLTIPVGFTPPHEKDIRSPSDAELKLPCGMMITGKLFDEAMLYRVADAWEQANDWKQISIV